MSGALTSSDSTPLPSDPVVSADASSPATGERPVVLEVKGLKTYFFTYDGIVRALDGVNLKIRKGETTGLVGETGCGKSVTAFSITRLISDPPGRIVEGSVHLGAANLLWGLAAEAQFKAIKGSDRVKVRRSFRKIRQANERMSAVRGSGIGMIFQEPSQAMNPIFSIADQIGETFLLHRGLEIVDDMLRAKYDTPEVAAAVDALIRALGDDGGSQEMRTAARAVGVAAGAPTLGTELFYLLRDQTVSPEDAKVEIETVLRHRKLPGSQARYLAHRRRLMEVRDRLHDVYLREMTEGRLLGGERRSMGRRRASERYTHFYYGLWGVRGRVARPLKQELFWRTVRLLEDVSIANPVQVARGYPHELSGGMLQRVMIAMALSAEPEVLIADEPTTALDVTIQAQILELMRELKERVGTAIMLITHDLAVIAEVADRVNVMYAGNIVESAPVRDLFRHPLHPYSQGLLASIPRLDQPEKELRSIPGSVPNLLRPPTGCRFHPRCPYAMPVCKEAPPPMTVEGPGHVVACYLYKGPVATD